MKDDPARGIIPPPVEGGTGFWGSRGRFLDRLMGDRKIRARAEREVDELVARSQTSGARLPAEPPAARVPPPAPAGDAARTKGRRRSGWIRPRQAR